MQRVGHAVAEYGLPFPRVSDDDLEQWLVAEAVMSKYHDKKRTEDARHEARAEARGKADAWAAEQKRQRGGL